MKYKDFYISISRQSVKELLSTKDDDKKTSVVEGPGK